MKWPALKAPLWIVVLAVLGVTSLTAYHVYQRSARFFFDDAFMFYRYAMNFRHGLGWSWNLDGVHTYGMTSLTWQLVVLLVSFLPLPPAVLLLAASTVVSYAGFGLLAWFIARRSRSALLRAPGNALVFVTAPLLIPIAFRMGMATGMDTMLGFFFSALVACLSIDLVRRPTLRLTLWTAVAAYLSIATRPESALCAVFVPALALAFCNRPSRLKLAVVHVGCVIGAVVLQMAAARLYFGYPLPLASYLKTRNAYEGFIGYHGASASLISIFQLLLVYFVVLALCAGRRNLRIVVTLLLPFALTVVYLGTVVQIMGLAGRYYLPYLPYVVIAAWVALDDTLGGDRVAGVRWPRVAVAVVLIAAAFSPLKYRWERAAEHRYDLAHTAMPLPQMLPATVRPLPDEPIGVCLQAVSEKIAPMLDPGSWLAATEVGHPGASAPRVNILDLAGLNSRDVTMSAFDPEVIFRYKPVVLWMPHSDYTGMNAALLNDARLYREYDYFPGAYCYGIAVRKDSSQHDRVLQAMAQDWPHLYPGTRMQDYLVHTP